MIKITYKQNNFKQTENYYTHKIQKINWKFRNKQLLRMKKKKLKDQVTF